MNSGNTLICDWFAASQVHHHGTIRKCEGIINCVDANGELEWQNYRAYRHEGSFDTSLRIKSDGNRVSLAGNIGRLCRADNVFGYGVDDCKLLANAVLEKVGLPPFSNGERHVVATRNSTGDFVDQVGYTGAKISQIHLTRNFSTGSQRDASDFLYWLTTQKIANTETTNYKSDTVYFGERSKFQRTKVYNKATAIKSEINRLNRRNLTEGNRIEHLSYLNKLHTWSLESGLVRFETELKSRYLTQHYINDWAACTNATMLPHYEKKGGAIMKRCENYADLSELPARAQDLYYAYMAGENLKDRHNWSTATFYRYKKLLLSVGIDISQKLNVTALKVRPRIISLTPAEMPEFYHLPDVAELKKAA